VAKNPRALPNTAAYWQ